MYGPRLCGRSCSSSTTTITCSHVEEAYAAGDLPVIAAIWPTVSSSMSSAS